MLLAPKMWRPEKLLKCIGHPPTTKNYLAQTVNSTEIEKTCAKPMPTTQSVQATVSRVFHDDNQSVPRGAYTA